MTERKPSDKNYRRYENPFPEEPVKVYQSKVESEEPKKVKVDPTVYQERMAMEGNVYDCGAGGMTDKLYL